MPDLIPMVSDIDLENHTLGGGLKDKSGEFSKLIPPGLETLINVSDNIIGVINHRDSIPSVLSQEMCFQMVLSQTMKGGVNENVERIRLQQNDKLREIEDLRAHPGQVDIAEKEKKLRYSLNNLYRNERRILSEKQQMLGQWRGALCTAILYQQLFALSENDPKSISKLDPIWKHIAIDSNRTNPFMQAIERQLPENHKKAWDVLAVHYNDQLYPLLQESEICHVVPCCEKVPLEAVHHLIPWIEPSKTEGWIFTDPLKPVVDHQSLPISLWQLHQVRAVLLVLLDKHDTEVRLEVNAFLQDINNVISDTQATSYQAEAMQWDRLLQVLALRDACDTALIVQKITYAQATPNQPTRFQTNDNPIHAIVYQKQVIAYLHPQQLLVLQNPTLWIKLDLFLTETLAQAFMSPSICSLLRQQLIALKHTFPEKTVQLQKLIHGLPSAVEGDTHSRISLCFCKGDETQEALQGSFSIFRPLVYAHVEQQALFSQKIIYWKQTNAPEFEVYDVSMWSEIATDHTSATTSPQTDASGMQTARCIALLPLSELGGKTLHRCYQDSDLSCKVQLSMQNQNLHAAMLIQRRGIVFEVSKIFQSIDLQEATLRLPQVATWPRYQSSVTWKAYYTLINYIAQSEDLNDPQGMPNLTIRMYDDQYNPVSIDKTRQCTIRRPRTKKHITEHWQLVSTDAMPSFCTFHNPIGETVGVLPLIPPSALNYGNQSAILAVDFGSTSTVAAIYIGQEDHAIQPGNIQTPLFDFDNPPVGWHVDKKEGELYSADRFIAEGFNVLPQSNPNDKGVFFTAIRRPPSDIQIDGKRVMLDGHIHFLDAQPSQIEGNIEYGLKLSVAGQNDAGKCTSMAQQSKANAAELFLTQALQSYFLFCRTQGIRDLEVRFAVPLGLSNHSSLEKLFSDITPKVATQAGIELKTTRISKESQAVGVYYSRHPNYQGFANMGALLAVDVGGGTTDYAYWLDGMHNNEGKPIISGRHSSLLAGRELIAYLPYLHLHNTNSNPEQGQWFINGLTQAKRKLNPSQQYDVDQAFSKDRQTFDDFCFQLDTFVNKEHLVFQEALQGSDFLPLRQLLIFEFALLFWYAGLVGEQENRNVAKNSILRQQLPIAKNIQVFLAGNGIQYYHMLPEKVQTEVFPAIFNSTQNLELHDNSIDRKCEVVKGLLMMTPSDFQEVDPTADLDETIDFFEKFRDFLSAYNDAFSSCPDERLPCIAEWLVPENIKYQRLQLLCKAIHNMQGMCTFMKTFRDMIVE